MNTIYLSNKCDIEFFKAYTKEFSYNLKLAYPVIIGMIGHTLVGFVDNAMVGQLGTLN